jgi:hypothetical protein
VEINTHETIKELPFPCNGDVNMPLQQYRNCCETVFPVEAAPRLYNEDPRPAETELRESLETAVGNN